jgi:branched-chain amino acid transport system substrate-binding protein
VISESGDNITGCFITGAFSRESPRPVVKEFAEAFEREYKRPPGTFEALGYDAAAMLAEAMRKGVSPENIRDGLGSISKLEAVTGVISSASDGNVSKAAVILEIVRDASGKYGTKYLDSAGP